MSTQKKLSYNTVCDFFEGKNDISDLLSDLIEENPAFGIINEVKQLAFNLPPLKENPKFSFSKAEKYLEDYFCGNLSANQGRDLISAILNNEKTFRILMHKVDQHKIISSPAFRGSKKQQKSDKELFKIIKRIESDVSQTREKTTLLTFFKPRLSVTTILSTAAAFLILFLLPLQKQTDLADTYNFDSRVPLSYYNSGLRGNSGQETVSDPEMKPLINIFKNGMADYLANDYLKAIEKWQVLENKISLIEAKESPEMDNFVLYYALSHLSLATTQKELKLPLSRKQYLDKSIELLEKLKIDSDLEKYYYALSLVLDGQKEKAVKILKTIKEGSEYEERTDVLMEQINL